MAPVIVSILLALVIAALVLVVAARAGGGPQLSDLRSVLQRGDAQPRLGIVAGARREHVESAEADSGTLEDFLRSAATDGAGYLRAEDIAAQLRLVRR